MTLIRDLHFHYFDVASSSTINVYTRFYYITHTNCILYGEVINIDYALLYKKAADIIQNKENILLYSRSNEFPIIYITHLYTYTL